MRRRGLLAGALALVAGCQSLDGDGTTTTGTLSPSSSPSPSPSPSPPGTAASPTTTPAAETVQVTPSPDLPDVLLVNERPGPVNVDLRIERLAGGGATVRSRVFMTEDDADEVGLPPGEVRLVVETDGANGTERFERAPDRTLVVRIYPDRVTFSTVARE